MSKASDLAALRAFRRNFRRKQQTLARLDFALKKAVDEGYGMMLHLVPQIIQAMKEDGAEAVQQNVALVEAMENDLQSMKRSLLTTHEDIAIAVQKATVASYEATLAKSEWPQNYRPGASDRHLRRFSNGVLLGALKDPLVIRATYDGIAFPNIRFLDRRAQQWHRLNFGTGGGGVSPKYSSSFGGLTIHALGFEGEGPSRPFRLPPGIWLDSAFYPRGEFSSLPGLLFGRHPATRPGFSQVREPTGTKRVEAWNFLDAGVRELADQLPQAYSTQFSKLMSQRDRGRGALSRVRTVVLELPPGGFTGEVLLET